MFGLLCEIIGKVTKKQGERKENDGRKKLFVQRFSK